jgi:hypothetical protein
LYHRGLKGDRAQTCAQGNENTHLLEKDTIAFACLSFFGHLVILDSAVVLGYKYESQPQQIQLGARVLVFKALRFRVLVFLGSERVQSNTFLCTGAITEDARPIESDKLVVTTTLRPVQTSHTCIRPHAKLEPQRLSFIRDRLTSALPRTAPLI